MIARREVIASHLTATVAPTAGGPPAGFRSAQEAPGERKARLRAQGAIEEVVRPPTLDEARSRDAPVSRNQMTRS